MARESGYPPAKVLTSYTTIYSKYCLLTVYVRSQPLCLVSVFNRQQSDLNRLYVPSRLYVTGCDIKIRFIGTNNMLIGGYLNFTL